MTIFEQRRREEKQSVQGTSSLRKDTFRRLAEQSYGRTTSSGYGLGKPVELTTGAESLQHSRNSFLDGLQHMTPKAGMDNRNAQGYLPDETYSGRGFGSWRTGIGSSASYNPRADADLSAVTSQNLTPYQEQGHNDAGLSSQGDAVELTDQEKHDILRNLKSIGNDIYSAKRSRFEGYDENSHFMTNYRIIAKYRQNACEIPHDNLEEAYEAYEEIKRHYGGNLYNKWEKKRCENLMGLN